MPFAKLLRHFDNANLRLRVISSLILAPITLLAVYWGGFTYDALVMAVFALGLFEWLRLVAPLARTRLVGLACLMLVLVMVAAAWSSPVWGVLLICLLTPALFLAARRETVANAQWLALGLPYLGGGGLALLALRRAQDHGAGLVFFLLITVWATDIGAFVAGRSIGGPRLAPRISPSKTWAGLFGGMASALVLGYLAAAILTAMRPVSVLWLAPLLAAVAQLGDLFESYVKRRAGAKDSGDLIPGHGGVLDRIDGLVFAAWFMGLVGVFVDWR